MSNRPDPVVTTAQGTVRGLRRDDGTSTFLNIPYAAPPTGAGRFAPPQPHEPMPLLTFMLPRNPRP